jgi:hypothetical protein
MNWVKILTNYKRFWFHPHNLLRAKFRTNYLYINLFLKILEEIALKISIHYKHFNDLQ